MNIVKHSEKSMRPAIVELIIDNKQWQDRRGKNKREFYTYRSFMFYRRIQSSVYHCRYNMRQCQNKRSVSIGYLSKDPIEYNDDISRDTCLIKIERSDHRWIFVDHFISVIVRLSYVNSASHSSLFNIFTDRNTWTSHSRKASTIENRNNKKNKNIEQRVISSLRLHMSNVRVTAIGRHHQVSLIVCDAVIIDREKCIDDVVFNRRRTRKETDRHTDRQTDRKRSTSHSIISSTLVQLRLISKSNLYLRYPERAVKRRQIQRTFED
jgi:hypothetical protein